MSQDARDQLGRLIPLILLIIGATVLLVIGSLMVAGGRGEDVKILVLDVYELTGTRTAGLLTIIGVALLAITSAICCPSRAARGPRSPASST